MDFIVMYYNLISPYMNSSSPVQNIFSPEEGPQIKLVWTALYIVKGGTMCILSP